MKVEFPIAFEKMSGTGNDFIIIDNRQGRVPKDEQSNFAALVCRRMFSVGADGAFFLEESDRADFRWQFYNADGSEAEMCGNGARCVARFAFRHGLAQRTMRFETLAGIIEAEVLADEQHIRVLMTPPFDFRFQLGINLDDEEHEVSFLNTGVPHAVIFTDDENVPVTRWGRKVRFHEHFQPAGTNVNFIRLIGDNRIKCRTYERGVEDETRACGTGAVAGAIMSSIHRGLASPVEVETSGGDILTIHFDLDEGPTVQNVFLQGPTRRIYSGELTAEALL